MYIYIYIYIYTRSMKAILRPPIQHALRLSSQEQAHPPRVPNVYKVATEVPHSGPDLGWLVACFQHLVHLEVGWLGASPSHSG